MRFSVGVALALLSCAHAEEEQTEEYKPLYGIFNCLQCMGIQRAIHASIMRNISAQEAAGFEAEIKVADIISNVCKSDAWNAMGYGKEVRKGCTKRVTEHHRVMTQFWGEKDPNRYKSDSTVRWIMSSVCTQPKLKSCSNTEIGFISDDVDGKNRCTMCRTISKSLWVIQRMAKERPTSENHPDFAPLWEKFQSVCDDMGLSFVLPYDDKGEEETKSECRTFWKDYERLFKKLAIDRSTETTRTFCSTQPARVCDLEMTHLPHATDEDVNYDINHRVGKFKRDTPPPKKPEEPKDEV